ncbi:HpcH/HpaI aldolase/citrate lyase family protein [Mangrovicella endophytica]|uniref:HpcH/HpaI aldolase/citrate lyase family protein n=1 Tax=Mangrovicella endophytica TaxID=2066697 RepID=UPI000C9DE37E|nr:CoA ester lyase [Mangrovicella endophytica]
MTNLQQPRRSALYMPASNERAIAKSRSLDCDVVILDLEDAVAPDAKAGARANAVQAVAEGGFGSREVVVRVNAADTPYWAEDVAALAGSSGAVLIPKVGHPDQIAAAAAVLPGRPIWAMIETCEGVLNLSAIAASAKTLPLAVLVIGANDLAKEMGCRLGASRRPLWGALGTAVIAARAHGLGILDAVYNDIADEAGFEAECREGADFGFDGKTLIHPKQIEICNRAFSPSPDEIAWARLVVETFDRPENASVNALRIEGRMVERLHLEPAKRALSRA